MDDPNQAEVAMRIGSTALALCFSVVAALPLSTPVVGQNAHGCAGSDAVVSLPTPLNKWAQILCTPYGQVITGGDGWIWVEPVRDALVVIPSQTLDGNAKPVGDSGDSKDTKAYFTKIVMTKISGEEFDRAFQTFHADFEPKDGKPAGYRLELTTAAGDGLQLYFFDYVTYGWGIACPYGSCDLASRFVMVNMKSKPQPLGPAI
jgi:hypothetical protein